MSKIFLASNFNTSYRYKDNCLMNNSTIKFSLATL